MKMNGKWKWILESGLLFLAMICLLQSTKAQTAATPTLHQFTAKQAVEFGRKNNFQVKKALEDIRIQQQVNREVTASALPQLNGSINYTDNIKVPVSLVPGEFFGAPAGTFIPVQFGVQHTATLGATLEQILFDGQVFVGLQARTAAINYSSKTAEITEENVAVNIYKVYYQLLIGKMQLELYHDNIARFEKLYYDTREIYKAGFAEQLDVDKVNVTLTNLRTDSIRLQTQLNTGFLGMKVLLGIPMKDSIVQTEELNEEMLKENILDTAFNYSDRRDFQLLEIGKKLNQYNVKRYKYGYLPTITAFGNYYTNAQRNEFDFFKSGGDWFQQGAIGFRINIPIFDGFRKSAQIQQAKSNVRKIEYDMELTKLNIDSDVSSAYRRLRDAIVAVDAQRVNVKLAETVFDQTKKKYEQGLGSNTEINNAQTELRTAQTNLFSSLYDATVARVDYLKATGKIL